MSRRHACSTFRANDSTFDGVTLYRIDTGNPDVEKPLRKLDQRERHLVATSVNSYVVTIRNVGGLVMPVIMKVGFADKTSEEIRIPAEIWRRNSTAWVSTRWSISSGSSSRLTGRSP